ncbi:triphosphoribosyl-dephospho-CoA synthase CitG [uncultured Cohaesibacter sp.]|uniref:triphosphoribosyl-dephospho-CoA synthase CitG n=1 Tax=uncultured Cohaesibacter sp. TaxID=1002546 RepID=UPI0029C8B009|nr:triphosphoribosyl-dephospho-CoA synthase CitG [uncultured Cohaesibacter sp.]
MTTGPCMDENGGEGRNEPEASRPSADLSVGQGDAFPFLPEATGSAPEKLALDRQEPAAQAIWLGDLVHEALVCEATLTPKPGLVDASNSGSHKDMSLATFIASAKALRPLFPGFVKAGMQAADDAAPLALLPLRSHGLICEQAMHEATGGVNTHKGGIFALGLLLGAAGRLLAREDALTVSSLCGEAASLVQGLVKSELAGKPKTANTAGEYIFRRYGLTGARGEAESGFALVRQYSLPAFLAAKQAGLDRETALLAALLELLIRNRDTNLVARGGMEGLFFVRREAQQLKQLGGAFAPDFHARLSAMDEALIARNLSPGGSADLLAVTLFLSRIDEIGQPDSGEAP